MLARIFDVLQVITLVLSFIITVVESVYEGVAKAGEQKKKDALEKWGQVKPVVVSVIREVVGEKYATFVDKFVTPQVIGVLIDILVWYFNLRGIFKSNQG